MVQEEVRLALRLWTAHALRWGLTEYGLEVPDRRIRKDMERALAEHYRTIEPVLADLDKEELVALTKAAALQATGKADSLRQRLLHEAAKGTLVERLRRHFAEKSVGGSTPDDEFGAGYDFGEYRSLVEQMAKRLSDKEVLLLILQVVKLSALQRLCRKYDVSENRRSRAPMEAALGGYYQNTAALISDLQPSELDDLKQWLEVAPETERNEVIRLVNSERGRQLLIWWLLDEEEIEASTRTSDDTGLEPRRSSELANPTDTPAAAISSGANNNRFETLPISPATLQSPEALPLPAAPSSAALTPEAMPMFKEFQFYCTKRAAAGWLGQGVSSREYCPNCRRSHDAHWLRDKQYDNTFFLCVAAGEPVIIVQGSKSRQITKMSVHDYITEFPNVPRVDDANSWIGKMIGRVAAVCELEIAGFPPTVSIKLRQR